MGAVVVRASDVGLAVVVVVGPKSELFWWRLGIRL